MPVSAAPRRRRPRRRAGGRAPTGGPAISGRGADGASCERSSSSADRPRRSSRGVVASSDLRRWRSSVRGPRRWSSRSRRVVGLVPRRSPPSVPPPARPRRRGGRRRAGRRGRAAGPAGRRRAGVVAERPALHAAGRRHPTSRRPRCCRSTTPRGVRASRPSTRWPAAPVTGSAAGFAVDATQQARGTGSCPEGEARLGERLEPERTGCGAHRTCTPSPNAVASTTTVMPVPSCTPPSPSGEPRPGRRRRDAHQRTQRDEPTQESEHRALDPTGHQPTRTREAPATRRHHQRGAERDEDRPPRR